MSKCKAYMCKHGCMIPQDCPEDRDPSEGASSESAGPVSAFPLATGWEGLHRLAVTLAGQRDAALIDWRKWKDDPLMQDVAEHYAEKWAALGYVIACIDSRLRLAPPNVKISHDRDRKI